MKRIILLLSTLVIAGFIPLSSQTAAFNGFCSNGGKSASVNGLTSSNKLEQIIPSCTVSVYLTGTTTLAPAIYKDAINTPLTNPFTADNLSAIAPGKWLFFAPVGQGYDVVMSGGIAPLTFSSPVTLTDLLVGGGGGGGGGCTPIGLNGVLQASNGVGGCTAAYVQVDGINLVTPTAPNFVDTATVKVINPGTNQIGFNGVSSSPTIQHNDVTLAGNFSAGTSQILDFNDTTPTPPAGYVNAIFQPDTVTGRLSAYVPSPAGTFEQQLPNPLGTQHVILYPTGVSTSTTGQPLPVAGLTSATLYMAPQCAGSRNGQVSWTFTGALAAQAPWVIPANVTAVYAFFTAGANVIGGNPIPSCLITPALVFSGTVTTLGVSASLHGNSPLVPYVGLTSLTGSNVNTATASAILSVSGNNVGHGTLNIANMGLVVYYTGTAPPPDNAIEIVPPLQYSTASGFPILSLDPSFPTLANTYTVAALPPAATSSTQVAWVSDGVSATDCTTGGAAMGSGFTVMCAPTFSPPGYTGSWAWAAISGGGGGGSVSLTSPGGTLTLTPNPITGTGTMDVALGHANTWTATQTFSNVKDTGAAAGSATACLQIDTTGLISNTGTTCGGGGGGGSNVKVNGGTALTTVNLNSTTPAAGALNQNLAFQVDGSGNTSVEVPYGSASNLGVVKVDGTTITASGGVISAPSNGPVCSGSITLTGATIPGSTAGTNQPVTCTGLLTTDNIMLDFNGSPLSTNGFVPASGGPITIVKYPSANTINVTPVNYNSSSVTLGSITLNYRVVRGGGGSGGSGGVQYNPSATTQYIYIGDSRYIINGTPQLTASAVSCTGGGGGTCTITSTQSLVAGSGHDVTFNTGMSPSCLSGAAFTITSATGSSFVIPNTSEGGLTACGTTSGTGGIYWNGDTSLPEITSKAPFFNGHGITINMGLGGDTVAAEVTNYTARYHTQISSCVLVGGPCYVIIESGFNDFSAGANSATVQANLQSLWALIHADGGIVDQSTIIRSPAADSISASRGDFQMEQTNSWIIAQGSSVTAPSTGEYTDYTLPWGETLTNQNGPLFNADHIHLNSDGTYRGGQVANNAMAAQASFAHGNSSSLDGINYWSGTNYTIDSSNITNLYSRQWANGYLAGFMGNPNVTGNFAALGWWYPVGGAGWVDSLAPANCRGWTSTASDVTSPAPDSFLCRQAADTVSIGSAILGSGATSYDGNFRFARWEPGLATAPTVSSSCSAYPAGTLALGVDLNIVQCSGTVWQAPSWLTGLVPAQYKIWTCETGLGDGLNAVPAATYLQSFCYNTTGVSVTLTGLKCYIDGGSSSTMNAAGNTLGALLTGAVTCSTAFAAGTQSANVTLTSGDYIKFTFVADGTAKQTTFVVTGTY